MNKIQRVLIRSAMRQSRKLQNTNKLLFIQSIPSPNDFQSHATYPTLESFLMSANLALPGVYKPFIPSRLFGGDTLRQIIRFIVRIEGCSTELDDGFKGLKFINEQVLLAQMSSMCVTRNIRIVCTAIYDKENSNINDMLDFIYYYRISLVNEGDDPVQLLSRSWTFKAGEQILEVPKYSPGVIGLKPILHPGESFQYMSSVIIAHEIGTMEGTFMMLNLRKNEHFEARIEKCALLPRNTFE